MTAKQKLLDHLPYGQGFAPSSVFRRTASNDQIRSHVDARANWEVALFPWPNLPEVMGGATAILRALIREYILVSPFRACAESLASENASRLAAKQRAGKNIIESLEDLNVAFHGLRQSGIDEELCDVIISALSAEKK